MNNRIIPDICNPDDEGRAGRSVRTAPKPLNPAIPRGTRSCTHYSAYDPKAHGEGENCQLCGADFVD